MRHVFHRHVYTASVVATDGYLHIPLVRRKFKNIERLEHAWRIPARERETKHSVCGGGGVAEGAPPYLHIKLSRQMRRRHWKGRPGDHLGRLRSRSSPSPFRRFGSGGFDHPDRDEEATVFRATVTPLHETRRVINDRGVGG